MLAHALLAATSTGSTSPTATLIRLTCDQPRRLRQTPTAPPTPTLRHALHWSH